MNQETVLGLAGQAMWVIIQVASPAIIAGLVVGLIVSIFQAATSIQEQSLTFVPKVAALGIVLLLCGAWMLTRLVDFARMMFANLPSIAR